MGRPQFEVVEESPGSDPPDGGQENSLAFTGLWLALKALSQRALVALEACFTLLTVFGVWLLWHSIPDPNTNQIVSLSIFAAFVLLANLIVILRRRR